MQALQCEHRLDDSGCRNQMPERPFERRGRRRARSEDATDRGSLGGIRLQCAVAVRGDHSDFGSTKLSVRERRFDRAREGIAVLANREQALRVGGGAASEHFAQNRGVAGPR